MRSDELARRAHEYLEGSLDPQERAAFAQSLEQSQEAREVLDEMTALGGILRTWEAPAPSEGFADRVIERIRASGPQSQDLRDPATVVTGRYWRIPAHVGVAAAILLVVSIAFNFLWILYRDALLSGNPSAPASRSISKIPVAFEGPAVPAAFYYYLDPREDGGAGLTIDEDEEIGP